jgi:hypothetical protein
MQPFPLPLQFGRTFAFSLAELLDPVRIDFVRHTNGNRDMKQHRFLQFLSTVDWAQQAPPRGNLGYSITSSARAESIGNPSSPRPWQS